MGYRDTSIYGSRSHPAVLRFEVRCVVDRHDDLSALNWEILSLARSEEDKAERSLEVGHHHPY